MDFFSTNAIAFTMMGRMRQYQSMAESAPTTRISGRMVKARLTRLSGLVTANGGASATHETEHETGACLCRGGERR